MSGLTGPQRQVFDFIRQETGSGRPSPTIREIAERFSFKSPRAAACHVEALKRKGYIRAVAGKARTLRPTVTLSAIKTKSMEVPVFGSIPAGIAENRFEEAEETITVDPQTVGIHSNSRVMALRVSGDSMIGKQICDGDIALLEHGGEPRNGQTVAALIDGKSTLKTFVVKSGRTFLKAENRNYPDLVPCEELIIQGILRGLIRKLKE
jgi:repressor LexA